MEKKKTLSRPCRVKNKNLSPIQITAEQIIRESRQSQTHPPQIAPKFTDQAELDEYRLRTRKNFEDSVKRNDKNSWLRYANWEASNKDFARARSIFERALQVDYRDQVLWLKYADFEITNKFFDHARNVLDRAVLLLPRVDKLWCKYVRMEHQVLKNIAGARQVFERWMDWMPDARGWKLYAKFEVENSGIEAGRAVFERFVECHPAANVWCAFAKFEAKHGGVECARRCYERAVCRFEDDADDQEEVFIEYAEFEERCKEIERARVIYEFALDGLQPKGRGGMVYGKFVAFEKRYGDREEVIEDLVLNKRRLEYEEEVRKNPLNYDVWFDFIKLEENGGDRKRVEEVYQRAIANFPPAQEKRYWSRYIFLWINYALYWEMDAQDVERARDVYSSCLQKIPHAKFSFAKMWLMAAQFEIRQLNIDRARKILGTAIGMAPRDNVFKEYIEIELSLGNIDRCRKIYEKYLEWSPDRCYTWIKYAELEMSLGESERARGIFEIAVEQPVLDEPEVLWKAYIDIEIAQGDYDRARALYERLLNQTDQDLKVWISYAKFEASSPMQESDYEQKKKCLEQARGVFERAISYFRTSKPELKEERAILLEEWLRIETSFGELGDASLVRAKLPKKLKKRRRQMEIEDGCEEEYIDYIFPEETQTANLAILEAAYSWKRQKTASDQQ